MLGAAVEMAGLAIEKAMGQMPQTAASDDEPGIEAFVDDRLLDQVRGPDRQVDTDLRVLDLERLEEGRDLEALIGDEGVEDADAECAGQPCMQGADAGLETLQ